MITIIAAMATNRAIGKNKQLLWHLPNDMKRFKSATMGHPVIMGRKTFESLPNGPLPGRKNVVLTMEPEHIVHNAVPCTNVNDALELCACDEHVFVIGGGMVYKRMLQVADRLMLTLVHHDFLDADTFFPEVDFNEWKEVRREEFAADEKHLYAYAFVDYERVR